MRILTIVLGACALAPVVFAQDEFQAAARKELQPRPIVFSKPELPLSEVLRELSAHTGNVVTDQRRQKSTPAIKLPTEPTTFWPALDTVGRSSGIKFSPYVAEGGVALVDAPYRQVPVAYSGIFRIAQRRVAVSRDEETQARLCHLALEVAWEPRFRPFYVDLRHVKLTYAPDAKNRQRQEMVAGRGPVSVAGRTAIELDVQAAAPDRSSPRIALVEGTVWAVGPSAMLSFRFTKLAIAKPGAKSPPPAQSTRDGVTVTIASIRRQADALLVTVVIENSKGGPGFESHQSWLENNRIVLSQGEGNKKRTLTPTGSREEMRGDGARVVYEFAESAEQRLPEMLDAWTLDYETPGRIVELTVPFALKDIALP
jgi:hypothetical protein